MIRKLWLCLTLSTCLVSLALGQQPRVRLKAFTVTMPATTENGAALRPENSASSLATFSYTVNSSRDGNTYTGVMVGEDPFGGTPTPTVVNTPIVPVIITTNEVATGLKPNGVLTEAPGTTAFNPRMADDSCMSAPNDVPWKVAVQSPIFRNTDFSFGGTFVGHTQYVDAFQRANFWSAVAGTKYHTLLHPVVYPAVTLNVPANVGVAIPSSLFGSCGPLGIVNINTLYLFLAKKALPQLQAQGVDTSQFPVFLLYNVVMSVGPPVNLNVCCVLGFHGATGSPIQTFSPIDFDTSGLFGTGIHDTSIMAHEVGEWMDDPFGNNPTPLWGHTGQVGGCQGNLEDGDPLTGANVPTVTGANGYSYHLQELAFFSWFYGAPSIAANGWYSDNNSFTSDAGPVCQ